MMKSIPTIFFFHFFLIICFGQNKTAKDFGFKHLVFNYKGDNVDFLVKSKKGEDSIKKPLFFFCQGSLPQPLIKIDDDLVYSIFPFNPDSISEKYHIVIVGKPFIPLICDIKQLGPNFMFLDSTGKIPIQYSKRNLLDYYVDRNLKIINLLQNQSWVSNKKLVVVGHSEGSTVACKMASLSKKISHLIYSGGNPMGRIMSMIQVRRFLESDSDSTRYGDDEIIYWKKIVENKDDMDDSQGDTYKAGYVFSEPPIYLLEKIKIPVLVTYGSKDYSAPFNDFMQVDFIRKEKSNFEFKVYVGTEHNFFPLNSDDTPNYSIFNWDKVANDWLNWLKNFD